MAATLILLSTVKERFSLWENYLSDIATQMENTSAEELLIMCVEDAEFEFERYIDVNSITDMTKSMSADLMHLIRFEVFSQKHGDTSFSDGKPNIVKRYEEAMKRIKAGLVGSGNIVIEARERIFNEGFLQADDDNNSLTNDE